MVSIGALSTSITLESSSFTVALRKVGQSMDRAASDMRKTSARMASSFASLDGALTKVQGSIRGVGAAAVAALSVGAITNLVSSSLEYASSLGETAQQLGVTTTALQEYRFMATQVGIDQGTMDLSLGKLTRTIGEAAAGAKTQSAAFAALGVSIRDTNGQIRPTGDVLRDLVAGFSAMEDPAKRAALEVTFFGRSGQKLDTLLAGGIDQVDNLRAAAQRLGYVLSEDSIARADETADKLSQVKVVLQANIARVVADNSTSILDLANSLGELAGSALQAVRDYAAFKRLVRDEGAWEGFWMTRPEKLEQAGTPKGYFQYRTDQMRAARSNYENQRAAAATGWTSPKMTKKLAESRKAFQREVALSQRAYDDWQKAIAVPPKPKPPMLSEPVARSGGGSTRGGGGSSRRSGGKSDAQRAAEEEARALSELYDRLYPEEAKYSRFIDDLARLSKVADAGGPAADRAREAIVRLQEELVGVEPVAQRVAEALDFAPQFDAITPAIQEFAENTVKDWDRLAVSNIEIARSFVETTRQIESSLFRLTDSIKGGDFIGILEGVLSIFDALNAKGPGGKSIFSSLGIKIDGARANGGPVMAGKTYLVGERGPELFSPRGSGQIIANENLPGRAIEVRVHVDENEMFASRVTAISDNVAVSRVGEARTAAARAGRRRLGR